MKRQRAHVAVEALAKSSAGLAGRRVKVAAGEVTRDPDATTCCYAQSDKIWVNDRAAPKAACRAPAATGNEAEITFAFADAYRILNDRISLFTSLPLASLNRLSLQRRLDDIGRTSDRPAPAH